MTGIRRSRLHANGSTLRRFGRGAAFGAAFMCGASSLPAPAEIVPEPQRRSGASGARERVTVRARVAPNF